MPDSVQTVVGLVWAGLIAAWLAYHRSTVRTHLASQSGGGCTNCGAVIGRSPRYSASGRDELCTTCFGHSRRRYSAAAWLFLGLAALFLVFTPFIGVMEYRRFGAREAVEAVTLLLGATIVLGYVGWRLRRLGRSERT